MRQCVCKGWHFSWPRIIEIKRNRTELEVEITFPSDFAYNLGDSDQEDWIKIDGLYWFKNWFSIFNTHYLSVMLGAAYNAKTETLDLIYYYHDNNSKGLYNNDRKVNIPIGSTIKFKIIKLSSKKVELTLEYKGEVLLKEVKEFSISIPKWSNRVNYYFGGNRKAPNKTCLEKKAI